MMQRVRGAWQALLPDAITRWVLLLGLIGALPLVLLTPPFQVPDEPQHFERAYQISRLDLIAHVEGGAAGGVLPTSLSAMVEDSLGTTAVDADRPVVAQPLRDSLAGLSRPLEVERTRFTNFTGAAPYSPLPYLPQATAIGLGRLLGLGPLPLLYLARLANAVAAILLVASAVRIVPVAREGLALAGLLPMALYQYGSASPDAMTIATALVFTALAIRASVQGWSGRGVTMAAMLAAVFCSHKLVYAPLLLAALVPAMLRAGRRRRVIRATALIVLAAGGTAIGWLALARGLALTRIPGTDVHAQAVHVASDPGLFLAILWANLQGDGYRYFTELVGVLGWLAVPLPPITYTLAMFGVILTTFIRRPDEPDLPRLAGAWHLLLVASGIILVELALYVTWNPVGSPQIVGVQGRYLLPLLPLFLVGLRTLTRLPADAERSRIFGAIVLALIAAQIIVVDATIVTAYSLF